MTIVERALQLVPANARIGLGSGRAAQSFVKALGERVRNEGLRVQGVPTSEETARLARQEGIALLTLAEAGLLDLTVDGADEVDPQLDLIKGYGRALVREKVVAASSRRLIILVGEEKLVPQVGTRGRLPVEVTPFALPLCERRLRDLDCRPVPDIRDGGLFVTDNGNHIVDCEIGPIADPARFERDLHSIPGVVGTGLFLNMAETILVGDRHGFAMIEERRRQEVAVAGAGCRGDPDLPARDLQRKLADTIKRRIETRAGGQIHALEVRVTGDQVTISGSASCYYHKQIALQGLLDANDAIGARRIDINIDVVRMHQKPGHDDADGAQQLVTADQRQRQGRSTEKTPTTQSTVNQE
jgi:ribose 5-phosphate isomerase A